MPSPKRGKKASNLRKRPRVDPSSVTLVPGRGSRGRGGGDGGFYWHILVGDRRCGHVFINVIELPEFGAHPSVQIHINKAERARGIGQVAYRLACEESGHMRVLAHMRKSNRASRCSAERAGFAPAAVSHGNQLTMEWRRGTGEELG